MGACKSKFFGSGPSSCLGREDDAHRPCPSPGTYTAIGVLKTPVPKDPADKPVYGGVGCVTVDSANKPNYGGVGCVTVSTKATEEKDNEVRQIMAFATSSTESFDFVYQHILNPVTSPVSVVTTHSPAVVQSPPWTPQPDESQQNVLQVDNSEDRNTSDASNATTDVLSSTALHLEFNGDSGVVMNPCLAELEVKAAVGAQLDTKPCSEEPATHEHSPSDAHSYEVAVQNASSASFSTSAFSINHSDIVMSLDESIATGLGSPPLGQKNDDRASRTMDTAEGEIDTSNLENETFFVNSVAGNSGIMFHLDTPLRSCIINKSANRSIDKGDTTMNKSVNFGTTDAVEYSAHSPTGHLKPIDEKDIAVLFTHCAGEGANAGKGSGTEGTVDDEEDAETAANSRILENWENMLDVSNDHVPKSHRRRNKKRSSKSKDPNRRSSMGPSQIPKDMLSPSKENEVGPSE